MKRQEAVQKAKELAEYFVYCCGEGEHYVSLIERLRGAKTRSSLLKAIYILIRYGTVQLKQGLKDINQLSIKNLFFFIRTGGREEISRFHSSLSTYIWVFEVAKIRQQERYLLELLG